MHAAMDELATLLECDRAHVVELVREYVEVQKRVFKCVTREQERADRAEVACGVLLTKIRSARDYAANAPRDLISRREVEIILAILKLEA
jgi:spermidine synthase